MCKFCRYNCFVSVLRAIEDAVIMNNTYIVIAVAVMSAGVQNIFMQQICNGIHTFATGHTHICTHAAIRMRINEVIVDT